MEPAERYSDGSAAFGPETSSVGLLEPEHQSGGRHQLVLTVVDIGEDVRITRVEVADLSPRADKRCDLEVKAATDVEGAGVRIGRPGIRLRIVSETAPEYGVR